MKRQKIRMLFLIFTICCLSSWNTLASNLILNPGFEDGINSWSLTSNTSYSLDSSFSKGGSCSLLLTKSIDLDTGELSMTNTVSATPGTYRLRMYYHLANTPDFTNSCYLIELYAEGTRNGVPTKLGSSSNAASVPVTSLQNAWSESYLLFNVPSDIAQIKIKVKLVGGIRNIWLDDFSLDIYDPSEDQVTKSVTPPQDVYTWEQVVAILAPQSSSTGKVVLRNGQPRLLINDIETPPIFYKARAKQGYGFYRDFKDTDMKLYQVSLNVGGMYPEIWLGTNSYDFNKMNELIKFALKACPDAFLVPVLNIGPYAGWTGGHPNDVCKDQNGLIAYGPNERKVFAATPPSGYVPIASYYSLNLRENINTCIADIISHMKTQPYWKRVVGVGLAGGVDLQWRTQAMITSGNFDDYSIAAIDCFRDYMYRKYNGNAQLLRDALGIPGDEFGFADLLPPTQTQRTRSQFRERPTDMLSVEFSEFLNISVAEMLVGFAQTIKNNAGKDLFVTTYYADCAAGTGRRQEGFQYLCNSTAIDMFQTVSQYNPWRHPGAPGGDVPSFGSMAVNGKFWLQEYDYRTWVYPSYTKDLDISMCFLMDMDMFRAVSRRDIGMKIAQGHGGYYYDLSGGYFHDAQMTAEIDAQVKFYKNALACGMVGVQPQMALIVDERSTNWLGETNAGTTVTANSTRPIVNAAVNSGVPYAVYSLEDLTAGRIPACSIYVFLNTLILSNAQKAYINTNLKNNNRTLVWIYAPGYIGDNGNSASNVSDITGITITNSTNQETTTATFVANPPIDPGNAQTGYVGASLIRFVVNDYGTTPLANYSSNGVAAAFKNLSGWRSVYIANPLLCTAGLLKSIALSSGVNLITDANVPISFSAEKFITVHGTKPGPLSLELPKTYGWVHDAMSGELLASNVNSIELDLPLRATRWLTLSSINDNLLAYYRMDENSWVNNALCVIDSSPNARHAYAKNHIQPNELYPKVGNSAKFDQTSSRFIQLQNVSGLDLGTNDFSLSFWIKRADNDPEGCIFAKNSSPGLRICYTATQLKLEFVGTVSKSYVCSRAPANDTWEMITIVADRNGECTFYYNGEKESSVKVTDSATVNLTGQGYIGRNVWASGENACFQGAMDEFRIWNRTLSAIEVKQLFLLYE